jgi:hypothetical protein
MFLGWIDMIRFALVDEQEFERKFLRVTPAQKYRRLG